MTNHSDRVDDGPARLDHIVPLNFIRLRAVHILVFGLLGRERLKAASSDALSTGDVVRDGVRARPEINAIATHSDHETEILLWNYHDEDLPALASLVELSISGLPETSGLAFAPTTAMNPACSLSALQVTQSKGGQNKDTKNELR